MNKKLTLVALSCIIALMTIFSSCKNRGEVEINSEFASYISAFSYGRISSSSDIRIELTQDMPSVEINTPIDEKLFDFSPSIKGSAYWINSRTIKFVPQEGELKVGEKYHATFKLHKVLEVADEFKNFEFSFHVPEQSFKLDLLPYSPIKDNDLTWNSVQGILTLADVADVNNIQKMFSISSSEASVKITPTEIAGRYNVLIDSLRRKDSEQEYTLKVNGSPISSKTTDQQSIFLPGMSGDSFDIIDTRVIYQPQLGIRITFSDPLSLSQNIQGLISLGGVENYSYDINKNVLTLYIDNNNSNSTVDLTVHKELKSSANKRLNKGKEVSLSIERDKPAVKVSNSGNILPNSESLVIPFQAINLWAVEVRIIKIFESNILGYLQSNNFGESSELKRYGRLILKRQIRLDEDPAMDLSKWNDFSLDIAKLIKQDPGSVYRIEFGVKQEYSLYQCAGAAAPVAPTDVLKRFDDQISEEDMEQWDNPGYYYSSDYNWDIYNWRDENNPCTPSYYMGKSKDCIVLASNIGLTAKLNSRNQILVAVNDIMSTKPLSGIQVDVYNFQMQRIGQAKTDGDGFADIKYKGGVPFAVIASKGKEKGYLKVASNLALSLSNFDVSGKELPKGLKGYIYGERGVWRPGDPIFLTFILEDKDKALPKDHPVTLEFYTPLGQLYQRVVKTDSQNGFYPFELSTDASAVTGNWEVRINVGGVRFNKTLKIETVKPNRLKIRLDAGEIISANKGTLAASLSSQWLHGAPASNLAAKVDMTLSTVSNPFDGYTSYSFNNPASNFTSDTYTLFDGKLDSRGDARVFCNLPQAESAPGMLRANIVSRVFESGGDASINAQTVPYSPYLSYVGVKTSTENNYGWLETDTKNPIEIVTLNKDGKSTDSRVNVKVYKIKWSWWWSSSQENLSQYVNNTSTEVVLDETVLTNGGKAKVNLEINHPEWGRYLVIAKDQNSGHITGKVIYVDWPSWRGRSDKQDPNGLTMLAFSSDKQSYKVGEKATIIIPKSSKGRALVSLEQGGKILEHSWIETNAGSDTKYSFKITENMAPNTYVSVNLLQPHDQEDNSLPIRMYGVINISVDNEDTRLVPVLKMPDELRPEAEFTVTVSEKNKKDMTYTLAIVDEGLLDLTNFKTPNAWNDFYARQALTVRTWDMYNLVVGAKAGQMGTLLSIGGDEALKPAKNTTNRFKPVVKYLGPFTLKGGKSDTHKISLPPYFGSVRAMIVAGNEKGAYGNTEKAVQVKNPLMILSTLPRVAGPEEEIMLPVNIFAMDNKVKTVNVSVEATNGLFQFVDEKSKSVSFTEQGDKILYFKVKVAKKTGFEKVTIRATGGGETATETIDIEIRNPNPQILLSENALVQPSDSVSLKLNLSDIKADDWVKMEISRMPGVNLNKNLAYLLGYPHGCSEQITSKVLPQLYIKNFRTISADEKTKIDTNIKAGIKEITARQLGDGGIVYWPGNSYPTEWVTSYAGHFLIEAQKAGYEVPESVINKWKAFQKKSAQSWGRRDLYNSYYQHSMTDLQQAYRLYTLALAGDPELGAMNRLKEMDGLTVQARWRLAAAYLLAGKKDAAKQLIEKVSDEINGYSFSNNTYGSASRDMAMIMETHLLFGNVDKALKLSYKVSESLSADYISTQDAAFGLISMSLLAEKMGKGLFAYEWYLNGVKQSPSNQGSVFQEITIKPQDIVNVGFRNKGDGQLFVRLLAKTQPLGDNVPAKSGDVKLHVSYLDLDDKPIDVSSLIQGTEFYAHVVVQNTSGVTQTDMALNQIFASGWEIFNERLFNADANTEQGFNYQDIRDDRVLTYFNLGAGYSKTFKVKLQAAYKGRYYLPGISSEVMYNAGEQSRSQGRWVEVK